MNLRKNRTHQQGWTNKDYRVTIDQLGYTKSRQPAPDPIALETLIQPKQQNFAEIIKQKFERAPHMPLAMTQTFYQVNNKTPKEQANVGKSQWPPFEKIGKRVFTGDSNWVYDERLQTAYQLRKPEQKIDPKPPSGITQKKYDLNALSIQETQLISLDNYNKETLSGKVNLEKVREIRRALRRRYGNRTNIQKVFTAWDVEKKGSISIKNAYDMINRMGIQCNMNEALVLIASANQNRTSQLTLDEFLDLIYNVNDALNVNLTKLPDLSNNADGTQPDVISYLQQDANQTREIKRQNQLKLLLKNQAQQLANQCKREDPTNTGKISSKKMEQFLGSLAISMDIFREQDKERIFKQFQNEGDNTFNYGGFIKDLKDFQYNLDSLYVYYQINLYDFLQEQVSEQKIFQPQTTFSPEAIKRQLELYEQSEQPQFNWKTSANQPINKLEQIYSKKQQIISKLENKKLNQKHFQNYLNEQIKLNEGEKVENQIIQQEELRNIMANYFQVNDIKLESKDIDSVMAYFNYNQYGYTKISNIPQLLFNLIRENDQDFCLRQANKNDHGPPPHQKPSTAPIMEQSKLIPSNNLQLMNILNKFESKVYFGTTPSLKVYRSFDIDGDGYVSKEDLETKLNQLNLFNKEETDYFISYLDPTNKKYLTYDEFTKKIKPNMGKTNDYGLHIVVPKSQPSQQDHKALVSVVPSSVQTMLELRKPFLPTPTDGKTRFSATPVWKNTFVNFQMPQNAAGFASNSDRFKVDQLSKIQFQIDEKEKKQNIIENKIQNSRAFFDGYEKKIQNDEKVQDLREINKYKQKGLAQWTYEHKCHLQNPIK